MSIKKLAVVATHPIQHFVPVYEDLSKRKGLEIKVFYLAENGTKSYKDPGFGVDVAWDFRTLDGYNFEFLEKGKIAKKFSFFEMDSKNLIDALKEFGPDAVWINGYSYMANWRVVHWRKRNVLKIYTSDSNLTDERKWWQKFFKKIIVNYFYKQCDAFISIGPNNTDYLKYYGAKERNIYAASYPTHMERLLEDKRSLTSKDNINLRNQYSIPEDATLLIFSGKLVAYKRPSDIVEALAKLKDTNVYAIFMGDGELREELLQRASDLGVSEKVKITGFINQTEIARFMNAVDVLILPSEKEPYGAVVAEGLPFALPAIVSDRIGCINSSAIPDVNALVYKCGETSDLAAQICLLHNDTKLCRKMSEASYELMWKHDRKIMADVIASIVQ